MHRTRLMHVESLEMRRLLTASSVSGLPEGYSGADLNIYSSSDDAAYFSLSTAQTGAEVWQTDGTTEGTRIVSDLVPGVDSSNPQSIVRLKDRVFFLAYGSVSDDVHPAFYLWSARHNESPVALAADQEIATPALLPFGEQLAFVDLQTNRIWTTDGTEMGTKVRSEPILPKQSNRFDRFDDIKMTTVGNAVFITTESDAQLRRWTGAEQVDTVGDFSNDGQFQHIDIKQLDDATWMRVSGSNGSQLRKYDPASGDFLLVHEWQVGHLSWNDASSFDGKMIFTLSREQVPRESFAAEPFEFTNKELWITDGTTTGTTQIITPDRGMISATHYGETGIAYVQLGPNGSYNLWHLPSESDSPRKLHEFERIVPQHERALTPVGSTFYFVDGSNRADEPSSLYRFDGMSSEPELARTFSNGIISGLQVHEQQLLFTANDGNGTAIWFSDGSTAGTRAVRSFDAIKQPSRLNRLLNADGKLIFQTDIPTSRFIPPTQLLWSRDNFGRSHAIAETTYSFAAEETADTSSNFNFNIDSSSDVWRTDGTRQGTEFLRYGVRSTFNFDTESPVEPDAPGIVFQPEPVAVGNTTYSVRSTVAHGAELWATTGNVQRLVKDILPGPFGSNPRDMVVIDDIVYFSARDRTTIYRFGNIEQEHEENWELWRSDGTEEGTYKLLEINPDVEAWPFYTSSSHVRNFIPVRTGFLFNAKFDGELNGGALGTGRGWFTSDGTTNGTTRIIELDGLSQLFLLPNQVVMLGKGGIWLTDGTVEGTQRIWELEGNAVVQQLSVLDEQAFFTETDDDGTKVFHTDGTAAGTRLIRTILGAGSVRRATLDADITLGISGSPLEPVPKSTIYFETFDFEKSQTTIWSATPTDVMSLHTFDGAPTVTVRPIATDWLYTVGNSNTPYVYQEGDLLSTAWYRGDSPEAESITESWILRPKSQQSFEVHYFDTFEFGARRMIMLDGLGYFALETEELGYELWRTDGTQEGTVVFDLATGEASSFASELTVVNGELYFFAYLETDENSETPAARVLMKISDTDELPGDVNGDGNVNFADFLKLSANFGKQNQALGDGDLNGNGDVDFADFLILSANFGRREATTTISSEPMQRNLENVETFFALYSRQS